jgi:hypothetical protein
LKARVLTLFDENIFAATGEGQPGREGANKELAFLPAWPCKIVCISHSIADGLGFGLLV